jgi:SAM-dependent methyltransferase
MDFTGERLIPDQPRDDDLYHEHIVRYLFAAQFAHGRSVLDAGCGAGYGSALLASAGAAGVLGVDIAPDAISYARSHYQQDGLSFAVHDIVQSTLAVGHFQLVVSFEVIEHLDDPARFVGAVGRLLAEDGLLIVSTPNPATYPAGNPFHKHEMSGEEFVALLRQSFPALALYAQDYTTAIALRPIAGAGRVGQAFTNDMAGQSSGTNARPTDTAAQPSGTNARPTDTAAQPSGTNARPTDTAAHSRFLPAAATAHTQPDYYVAVCARDEQPLQHALRNAQSLVYELPNDRLGERIAAALTLQRLLDDKNQHLAEKDAHIARLEEQMRQQSRWAKGLESQALALQKTWYVRLFGRLPRR